MNDSTTTRPKPVLHWVPSEARLVALRDDAGAKRTSH